MSSILRKIDNAINPDASTAGPGRHTAPHAGATNVPHGAMAPTNVDARHGGYSDPGYNNSHYATERGVHNSVNQVAPNNGNLPGPAPTTAGPHRSDLLNKLDPHVDSDMSKPETRAAYAAATGPAPNTAGPHRSDLLNKLDPTVDSNLDTGHGVGRGGLATAGGGGGMHSGAYNTHATGGVHGRPAVAAGGVAPAVNAPGATNGPHSSRLANKLDPAVDSNVHHGRHAHGHMGHGHMGHGQPVVAQPAAAAPGTTMGPHRSNLLNKLDPKVDSQTGQVITSKHI